MGRPERHHERNSGKRVTSHTFGSGVGHRLPRGGALLPLALAPVARLRLAAPRVGVGLAGLLRQWQRLDDCVLKERHLVRITDRVRVRVRGRVRGRVRVRVRSGSELGLGLSKSATTAPMSALSESGSPREP